jgi:hypothetical protein
VQKGVIEVLKVLRHPKSGRTAGFLRLRSGRMEGKRICYVIPVLVPEGRVRINLYPWVQEGKRGDV